MNKPMPPDTNYVQDALNAIATVCAVELNGIISIPAAFLHEIQAALMTVGKDSRVVSPWFYENCTQSSDHYLLEVREGSQAEVAPQAPVFPINQDGRRGY